MMESNRNHIYFVSDFHLGAPDKLTSRERELKIVSWLNDIEENASEIYFLGDIFDFWFEYKQVIPKGYTRLLGTIARLSDSGIKIKIFKGNHDMWIFDYLKEELKAEIFSEPQTIFIGEKKLYIHHGDGLGKFDMGYRFLKKVFSNKVLQFCFKWIHPDVGIAIANYFSKSSRAKTGKLDEKFLGMDKEWLILHSENVLKNEYYDYFIFGHRHLPKELLLFNNKTKYYNLGDWLKYYSYLVWDGKEFALKYFEKIND